MVWLPACLDQGMNKELIEKVTYGATAGFLATGPMTIAMEALHRKLPRSQRDPLPPQKLTMQVAEPFTQRSDATERMILTLLAHFGFGTAMGAIYGATSSKTRSTSWAVKGSIFGLAVYASNYLGLLPKLGLLRSPADDPSRLPRHSLMILAHLIYGPITAWYADHLSQHDMQAFQGPKRVKNRAA